jgi:predicted amidohydrolase
MKQIRIAAAQFENRSGDKQYNLNVIRRLTARAAAQGADVISFHECCITGYSHVRRLDRESLLRLSEYVPRGESTQKLIDMAGACNIAICAGIFEKDEQDRMYNTYLCVNGNGVTARYRKLHPFISSYLTQGNEYAIFDLHDWKCGMLICYDNNIIENVRATVLMGAEIIFMPHVTMCTPSPRPGSGYVDKRLWGNRQNDPDTLRREFDGPKGREWLMKWLPARAHDNGVYVVFTNPIGMDGDQLKNGGSLIIDPFGNTAAECRSFDDEITVSTCTSDKLEKAGGNRYRKARRPELYGKILSMENNPELTVAWMREGDGK